MILAFDIENYRPTEGVKKGTEIILITYRENDKIVTIPVEEFIRKET